MAAMSAAGLAVLALVVSPAELAARTNPPQPALITARTRWQVLTEHIVTAGIVRAGRTIAVTGSARVSVLVVTRLPYRAGNRVLAGHVVAEIDGRPVLLLTGPLPAYRDLREGDSGPDVSQLHESLELLGYRDFDPQGLFGPSTALALELLYQHLGYAPPLSQPHQGTGAPPRARRTPAPYLPMSEVVFIPAPSALVISVATRVGARISGGPLLWLAIGNPHVNAVLTAHQAVSTRRGASAMLDVASPRLAVAGRLRPFALFPAGAASYPVVVTSDRPLPQRLIGVRVRITLLVPVTAAAVLSVPLAAVFGSGPRRQPYVVEILGTGQGQRRHVPVLTGPTADGWVAVQPVAPGGLRKGSRVLVGIGR
jgi:hypothetical protein